MKREEEISLNENHVWSCITENLLHVFMNEWIASEARKIRNL